MLLFRNKQAYLGFAISFLCLNFFSTHAQDETTKAISLPDISGSVDTYYKYDLSGFKNEDGGSNIGTSFASDQNSFSIGMLNLILSKEIGKASFVGDIGVGPRNANSSGDGLNASIQNLYISYQLADKLTVTGGYMGTFVGYEVISPVDNFNYSTSYLFTNGPFQNAGVKLDYQISDKVGIMAGVFNDWNVYSDNNDIADFGAQLSIVPTEGWEVYVNLITGPESGTEIDLTTTYQVSSSLLLGLNMANYENANDDAGFSGAALYANYQLSDNVALGFRGEHFTDDKLGILVSGEKTNINAFTLSANIKSGPLTFIPEIRLDSAEGNIFVDESDKPTDMATQVLFAAIFAF
ncbi:MAG: hypothetical protein ACI85I_001792 [Arenicella sp.]|jgi:hypothetical protein